MGENDFVLVPDPSVGLDPNPGVAAAAAHLAPADGGDEPGRGEYLVLWNAITESRDQVVASRVIERTLPSLTDAEFVRGDANVDGRVNVSDPIRILGYLFLGFPSPSCLSSADPDDDGVVDQVDAVYLIDCIFKGSGKPPVEPTGACGADPTADLGCGSYVLCEDR